jgi:hypothetical protein
MRPTYIPVARGSHVILSLLFLNPKQIGLSQNGKDIICRNY